MKVPSTQGYSPVFQSNRDLLVRWEGLNPAAPDREPEQR
jgi:hypothetical protein